MDLNIPNPNMEYASVIMDLKIKVLKDVFKMDKEILDKYYPSQLPKNENEILPKDVWQNYMLESFYMQFTPTFYKQDKPCVYTDCMIFDAFCTTYDSCPFCIANRIRNIKYPGEGKGICYTCSYGKNFGICTKMYSSYNSAIYIKNDKKKSIDSKIIFDKFIESIDLTRNHEIVKQFCKQYGLEKF